MLFSNSPVKKVVEKLNPFSQKNKVSKLKFERKSDYRTFLKFIKDNTKEIEDIDISGEDKKRKRPLIIIAMRLELEPSKIDNKKVSIISMLNFDSIKQTNVRFDVIQHCKTIRITF